MQTYNSNVRKRLKQNVLIRMQREITNIFWLPIILHISFLLNINLITIPSIKPINVCMTYWTMNYPDNTLCWIEFQKICWSVKYKHMLICNTWKRNCPLVADSAVKLLLILLSLDIFSAFRKKRSSPSSKEYHFKDLMGVSKSRLNIAGSHSLPSEVTSPQFV